MSIWIFHTTSVDRESWERKILAEDISTAPAKQAFRIYAETREGGETYSVVAAETTGSGDEWRRRREGRDERDERAEMASAQRKWNGNGKWVKWKPKPQKIWFIYITSQVSFFFF
jgi:hypothetical protein